LLNFKKNQMKRIVLKYRNFLYLLALPLLSSCGYNSMVQKEEAVTSQWAQVQNVYQRGADLIPNLVNPVKGYAFFEKSTLTDVIEAI
jgi:LemA protein